MHITIFLNFDKLAILFKGFFKTKLNFWISFLGFFDLSKKWKMIVKTIPNKVLVKKVIKKLWNKLKVLFPKSEISAPSGIEMVFSSSGIIEQSATQKIGPRLTISFSIQKYYAEKVLKMSDFDLFLKQKSLWFPQTFFKHFQKIF